MIARVFMLIGMIQLTLYSGAQVRGVKESGATLNADSEASSTLAAQSRTEREWRDTIQNVSKQTINAIHVTFSCAAGAGRVQNDGNGSVDRVLQNATDHSIPPGGSYQARVFEAGDCKATTDAVVYDNDEVEGDPDKVDLIFERRRGAYQALPTVIPLLDEIAVGKSTDAEVIQILKGRISAHSNSGALKSGLTGEELTGESLVFGLAISLLQSQAWLQTPADSTPIRQPHLDELMQKRGMSLEQAHAFVTANKFREWQAELKDHLVSRGQH